MTALSGLDNTPIAHFSPETPDEMRAGLRELTAHFEDLGAQLRALADRIPDEHRATIGAQFAAALEDWAGTTASMAEHGGEVARAFETDPAHEPFHAAAEAGDRFWDVDGNSGP